MIGFKKFDNSLITDTYVTWLSDAEVMKFMDISSYNSTMDELTNWVGSMLASEKDHLFSIHFSGVHIGNVKVGNVDQEKSTADIGLMIGSKDHWGLGVGKAAVDFATQYCFNELALKSTYAGIQVPNLGSLAVFLKCGYRVSNVKHDHTLNIFGEKTDCFFVNKMNTNLESVFENQM